MGRVVDSCWSWNHFNYRWCSGRSKSTHLGVIMNFINYQEQAWSTAVYDNKGHNPVYICEGLDGESGEVQEIIKRMHRQQGLDLEKLNGEAGDVLWYIQGMHSEFMLSMINCEMSIYQSDCVASLKAFDIHHWSLQLGSGVGRVLDWVDSLVYGSLDISITGTIDLESHLETCLRSLTMIIHSAGLQLEDVAQFNIDKLASRQERGVLRDTGSNR